MFKNKGIAAALACMLAMGAWSGSALATTIDGVVVDPNSPLDLNIQAINFRESAVADVGDVLNGYGVIGSINGTDQATFCPGCDLNFTFTYTVSSVDTSGTNPQVVFNLGSIDFYVDDTQSFNVLDPSTAGVGDLWLALDGHTAPHTGFSSLGQLYATISGTIANPSNGSSGFGLLDVSGGAAASFVDTNTIADGIGGWADLSLDSSFQSDSANICSGGICYPISGEGQLIGQSAMAVPEPAEAGLLGLGLAALGFFLWRRRREAEGHA